MDLSNEARRSLLMAGLGGLIALLDEAPAAAQDPATLNPKSYRVVLENDHVRVLEFTGKPGMSLCGEGMHSHPAHLTVALSDWRAKATWIDGTSREGERHLGDVFWSEAETHRVENIGKSTTRALIIELKSLSAKRA